jgi:ankyrin repeat protein
LLDKGANPNITQGRSDGWTLHFATKSGYVGVMRLLLDNGATVNAQTTVTGITPLHMAAPALGHYSGPDVARLLLENGANVHAQDEDGCTPLHGAAGSGHIEVVRLLVEKGANVNAEVVRLLVEKGANVNAEVVRLLAEKGANGNTQRAGCWEFPKSKRRNRA